MNSKPWKAVFDKYKINDHDFGKSPFSITAEQIKQAVRDFTQTNEKEVRILCKQDTREDRPDIFVQQGLFILPSKNGHYVIVQGEGYVDIPPVTSEPKVYHSAVDFTLDTVLVGDSEMQHLDFAYAISLVRTFMADSTLILTIRGRKYTPEFSFHVGKHSITASSVQTEVDAGYEGKNQVVLVEAKNSGTSNVIIRQLYYPFRQWQRHTEKAVKTLFFEKRGQHYSFWQFVFDDVNDYNSIRLTKSQRFMIED